HGPRRCRRGVPRPAAGAGTFRRRAGQTTGPAARDAGGSRAWDPRVERPVGRVRGANRGHRLMTSTGSDVVGRATPRGAARHATPARATPAHPRSARRRRVEPGRRGEAAMAGRIVVFGATGY